MNTPKEIQVFVFDKQEATGISGIVVTLTVVAMQKNDYAVGPKFTDNHGRVCFTYEAIKREIELCQRHVPMDYISNIDEIKAIKVNVPGVNDINRLIDASATWGIGVPEWGLSEETIRVLKNSPNHQYKPQTITIDYAAFEPKLQLEIGLE